jgi:DNA-binding PadR family transcriptional regulator
MKQTKFNLTDESRDRKYFSIVPNYIINHSTLEERGFYLTLKRIAGEDSKVFYSARDLGKQCGISKDTVYRLIKSLIKRGWIKEAGTIPAKTKPRMTYAIVDIWDKNNEFYLSKKIVSNEGQSQSAEELVANQGQTSSQTKDTKEEPGKEKPKKEIIKEKGLVPVKGKYSAITSIGPDELQEVAQNYQVPVSFVQSKYDDMVNWHESTGKVRKNWLATLRNFVKSDAIKIRKEVSNVDRKRGIDASGI